VGAA
jgi:hypothetical protein